MIIRIPYEWVVFILGEKLAPHFNEICAAITLIGFFVYLAKPKKKKVIHRKTKDTRPIYIDIDDNGNYKYSGPENSQKESG